MCRKFFRELRKRGRGFLANVHVAVCGLGSSDYSQFCEAANKLRKLLVDAEKGAGAKELMPMAKLDDATSKFEVQVEAWKADLHAKLKEWASKPALAGSDSSSSNSSAGQESAAQKMLDKMLGSHNAAFTQQTAAANTATAAATATAVTPVSLPIESANPAASTAAAVLPSAATSAVSASTSSASASASSSFSSATPKAKSSASSWCPPPASCDAGLGFASYMSRCVTAPPSSSSSLLPSLILYGTVTGNAESIAQQVADKWRAEFAQAPVEIMSTEQFMHKPDNVRQSKQQQQAQQRSAAEQSNHAAIVR